MSWALFSASLVKHSLYLVLVIMNSDLTLS